MIDLFTSTIWKIETGANEGRRLGVVVVVVVVVVDSNGRGEAQTKFRMCCDRYP